MGHGVEETLLSDPEPERSPIVKQGAGGENGGEAGQNGPSGKWLRPTFPSQHTKAIILQLLYPCSKRRMIVRRRSTFT